MIAGIELPESGSIEVDGHEMNGVAANERPINMMFQSYAVFPHMNVFKNIAYGLIKQKTPKNLVKEKVSEMIKLVQLDNLDNRMPNQLSGGQLQRVALGRALIKEPKLLLLDEPLAALDKKLREQTQFELINLKNKLDTTFIVVTHDQEEAMTLSSRIALMDKGQFVQIGVPSDQLGDSLISIPLILPGVQDGLLHLAQMKSRTLPLAASRFADQLSNIFAEKFNIL